MYRQVFNNWKLNMYVEAKYTPEGILFSYITTLNVLGHLIYRITARCVLWTTPTIYFLQQNLGEIRSFCNIIEKILHRLRFIAPFNIYVWLEFFSNATL